MADRHRITAAELRAALVYDPSTGIFTWKSRGRARRLDRPVGSWDMHGYKTVRLGSADQKRSYKLHRLAWLYVHGAWPVGDIDHINGVRHDNRIENLRDVPRKTNLENRRRANPMKPSGLPLGVHRDKKKFVAKINVNGESFHLGSFETPEAASATYLKAKADLHAGYSREVGRVTVTPEMLP